MPAQYMFKDIPAELDEGIDPVAVTLDNMDRYGVERAMSTWAASARSRSGPGGNTPTASSHRSTSTLARAWPRSARSASTTTSTASGRCRASRPGTRRRSTRRAYYPVYATCAELGIPIFLTAGVPGPRVPLGPQKVELLDEVCWFFPELTIVMRHGAEPWTELAVKLMLKWPNLYYSTSAFAPKHYPKAIVDYANTRGAGQDHLRRLLPGRTDATSGS